MDSKLNMSITSLPGIGSTRAKLFAKLGISDLYDLVNFFPRNYEDRTVFLKIKELTDGVTACVRADILKPPFKQRVRSGKLLMRATAYDDTGILYITFFNANYLELPEGSYIFYGKVKKESSRTEMINPSFEPADNSRTSGSIIPVYRLTEGLSNRMIASAVDNALKLCKFEDILPREMRERLELAHIDFAYSNIHHPTSFESLKIAHRRLVFEEFLVMSLGMSALRVCRESDRPFSLPKCDLDRFSNSLPFKLTSAQIRCIGEIYADMTAVSKPPMRRLIQGDVGSGKTAVAAAAAYIAVSGGYQAVLMAPTEILASQHYNDLDPMFSSLGIRTALLTGGMSTREKNEVLFAVAQGAVDFLIATHSAFSKDVEFSSLALVITDEQHRFGVRQRSALAAKGNNVHVLVMSATPIPRTLALMMYGDLDLSILDELPPGRQAVDTRAVSEEKRDAVYGFMRKLFLRGRQGYVVCPVISLDDDGSDNRKSVEAYASKLKNEIFPDFTVEFVHGRMKSEQKDEIMRRFAAGEITLLVSTTVIEVGVNVPNAAIIVIENCERFGLSQLHQFRGRVGRGVHKSYCVLFSGSDAGDTRARLEAMCSTNDGFKIAEADLALRGPGDLLGERQSGLSTMRIGQLGSDIEIMSIASVEAKRILERDPKLELPEHTALKNAIDKLFSSKGEIFS